jgi:transcriptional repressor NrdR
METRVHEASESIRRRRECSSCHKRFTTFERIEFDLPKIIKRDGAREDYSRSKLLASFILALRKRPIANTLVEEAVDRIERKLFQAAGREIAAAALGQLVIEELRTLDKVAYVRFASVYRDFKDLGDFTQVIKEIN